MLKSITFSLKAALFLCVITLLFFPFAHWKRENIHLYVHTMWPICNVATDFIRLGGSSGVGKVKEARREEMSSAPLCSSPHFHWWPHSCKSEDMSSFFTCSGSSDSQNLIQTHYIFLASRSHFFGSELNQYLFADVLDYLKSKAEEISSSWHNSKSHHWLLCVTRQLN